MQEAPANGREALEVYLGSGVANFRSHLPNPWGVLQELPVYGPGFDAWIRMWFSAAGTDDGSAFLAGAVAGALTVVPVYFLGWFGLGRRAPGVAGAMVLVVLPLHARFSPTDDPASLLALLLTSSVALVVAAERLTSAALLGAAWLAWGLAVTTLPARPGFVERYSSSEVRVGFYRLRPRPGARHADRM